MIEKEHGIEERSPMKPVEKKLSTLSSLHGISKLLLSEHDLQKLLNTIAENARLVLDADLVILYEYDKHNDDVRIPPIIKGNSKELEILHAKGRAMPHKESITFKMLRRESPFYASTAKEDWVKAGLISRQSSKNPHNFFNREKIISSAGIPLCIKEEDEVVGVLFVNYRNYHRFTYTHKERIEMFANYAALAILNARLFEKKNQYVKQLSVLNEIGKIISSASTLDIVNILDLIYKQTKRLMDVTNFYIAFYDEKEEMIHFKLAIEDGLYKKIGEGEYADRKAGNGLTEFIIRKKKPLLLPRDMDKCLKVNNVEPVGKPAKSWLGAPMIVEDKALGVIGIQNFESENAYNEDQLKVLMTIASQAAIVVSKANIFQEKKKRLNELEALHEKSKEISANALDITSVLNAIIRRAVELSGAEHGTILLCDHENKKMKVAVTYNLDMLMGISIEFGVGLAGQVAKDGKPRIKNKYHKWENRVPIFKQEKYKDIIKAVAQVPLKSGDQVLGVLAVSSSDENRMFIEDDTRLLNSFAGTAAIALKNAKTLAYSQTLIENTPHAIIAVDRKGHVIEFNQASEQILGYPAKEVLGDFVFNLYWGGLEEARRINNLLLRSKKGKVSDVETSVRSKAGEEIPILFSGSLLYDVMGERIGSMGIMEDLRAIRWLEQKYRALYEAGKVGVEFPASDMKKICQEFLKILTKRVMQFKDASLSLVNDDNKLEIIASCQKNPVEKINDHLKYSGRSNIHKEDRLKIPLEVRNRNIIGEITIFKGKNSEFSVEEKGFLDRFASMAALIIEKAKEMDRTERTAAALHGIAHDIVELSGEDVYGEIWHKVTDIIARKVLGTSIALYRCDHGTDKSASLMQTTNQDLYLRLKKKLNTGEMPYQSTSYIKSDYLFFPTRSYGQSDRLEGFLLVEKNTKKDDTKTKFTEIESFIINMLASAVGIALFRWRRDTRQGLKK